MVTGKLHLKKLGVAPYEPVWRAMSRFTDERDETTVDELWVLEHPPVFTLGQAGRPEHVLDPGDIPVLQTDRGGQVTYHGPGQIVAYPLVDLRRLKIGIRQFVTELEQSVIDVLAAYSISAERRDGAPGIYVEDRKIASLGLRVRRGCTFHGLAFNIDMDLTPFSYINPCGYAGLEVTQVTDLYGPVELKRVEDDLIGAFAGRFGYTVTPAATQRESGTAA